MSDISKIKIQDTVYNIKDSELRHMMNVLLGIESNDTESDDNDLEEK